ncbi:MAG: hypothetical protein ACXAD7_07500 [Candidatus Kariarchaeaceae archaeon]|jgi:hypothetical protein
MDKSNKLKDHALQAFSNTIEFLKYVLKDFPNDKLEEGIGSAQPPLYLMKHIAGTASFWMKRIDRSFKHLARVEDISSFFTKLELQLGEFQELLNDKNELIWVTPAQSEKYSVPWVMIRSANHAMHHASMLIQYRHYYGLPPLDQTKEVNWGVIVDLPGNMNYR